VPSRVKSEGVTTSFYNVMILEIVS
jgi:hypothetical protein